MKKILILMAAAALMMACAGNSMTVEEQAKQYVYQMLDAQLNDDQETIEKLTLELQEWETTLNEEDKAKVEAAVQQAASEWARDNMDKMLEKSLE